jgi:hypothetical protein
MLGRTEQGRCQMGFTSAELEALAFTLQISNAS